MTREIVLYEILEDKPDGGVSSFGYCHTEPEAHRRVRELRGKGEKGVYVRRITHERLITYERLTTPSSEPSPPAASP